MGLCRGLIADGKIDQSEADTLHTWLMAHEATIENPVMSEFRKKLEPFIKRKTVDSDSSEQLLQLLSGLVGGKTEVGECLSATTLWLDDPLPEIVFEDRKFCLTGKFSYGKRSQCEDEVRNRGRESANHLREKQRIIWSSDPTRRERGSNPHTGAKLKGPWRYALRGCQSGSFPRNIGSPA